MSTNLVAQAINLVEQRIGLSAKTLERMAIRDLLEQVSGGDVASYLNILTTTSDQTPEWQRLIHALTIGETYFLRDKQHFTILRENILPQLTLAKRKQGKLSLTIWCLGCATGEEPYSIATTCNEFLHDIQNWQIRIVGSDINQRSIDIARQGVYRQWSFRHTPPQFQQRYFTPVGDSSWQIIPQIRQMVQFERNNILQNTPVQQADLIFCRNILMYFSPSVIEKIEKTLFNVLNPDGWLLMGQAEALRSARDRWIMHIFPGNPIYQKPSLNTPLRTKPISWVARPAMPSQAPKVHVDRYDQAIEAVQNDQLALAEHHLSELLTEYPDHAQGHTVLAYLLANRKAFPEAEAHLDAALNENALLANVYYIRAMIYMEQGALDEAFNSLNAALYCQRDHVLASFTLGNLHAQRGDLPRAHKAWQNTLKSLLQRNQHEFVSELSDITVERLRNLLNMSLDNPSA